MTRAGLHSGASTANYFTAIGACTALLHRATSRRLSEFTRDGGLREAFDGRGELLLSRSRSLQLRCCYSSGAGVWRSVVDTLATTRERHWDRSSALGRTTAVAVHPDDLQGQIDVPGLLAGRALWTNALDADDPEPALREGSRPRFEELAAIVDAHGRPWRGRA